MRHLLRPGGTNSVSRGTINSTISFRPAILSPIRSEASSKHPLAPSVPLLPLPWPPPFLFLPPPPQQRRFMRHNDQLFCRPGTLNSFSLSLSLSFLLGDLGIEDSTARPDLAFTVDVESSRAATSTQLYRRGVRVPPRPRVLFSRG